MDQLIPHRDETVIPDWAMIEQSGGGIAVSGDVGSGKSVFLRQLLRNAIQESEAAVFLFDPHGTLAKGLLRDCIHYGGSVLERTYYFAPGNPSVPIGPLNPLSVEPDPDDYVYRSRLEVKVLHSALLLLSVWGQENFDNTPLLYKWTTTIFRSLAMMGLSIADAIHFFDAESPLFKVLTQAVPDLMAQMEFRRFAEARISEQDEQIASTKNRIAGMLSSDVIRAHLGAVDGTVNVRQLVEEQAIVLVDFEPRGLMHHTEHLNVLANFWLSEIFHTVFNTPEERRLPSMVVCDELPVFRASAPLIAKALREIRKMECRFVGAFQGCYSFPEKMDDPLLRNMIQCGTRFYFRHGDPDDARHFARIAALQHLDPHIVRFEHWEDEQFVDGFDVIPLTDIAHSESTNESAGLGSTVTREQSHNWSHADSYSEMDSSAESQMRSTSKQRSDGQNESKGVTQDMNLVRQAFSEARSNMRSETLGESQTEERTSTRGTQAGTSDTRGGSVSQGQQSSQSRQYGTASGRTVTEKHTTVSRMDWRRVLRIKEFFSLDDLETLTASMISRQSPGQAIWSSALHGSAQVQVAMAHDFFEGTPRFIAQEIREFLGTLKNVPIYHDPRLILKQRQRLIEMAIQELRQLRLESQAEGNGQRIDHDPETGIGI